MTEGIYRFNKTKTNRWYIYIPGWKRSRAELEMVLGADTMLTKLSDGKDYVHLKMSETPFHEAEELHRTSQTPGSEGGAYYILNEYKGDKLNHEMWLCNVTLDVFGKFPDVIYFKVVM